MSKKAMFIGRWQPFHDGHKWLINKKLSEGKPILIAVRDIPPDEKNPFTTEQTVEMLNKLGKEKMVYSENISRIAVGDTITWVPTSKGHNVHFIAGPDGWDLPKKSKNNEEVVITFVSMHSTCYYGHDCAHRGW